ncbi:MAG: excalibur calcium-binding domain-containing protein [Sulfurimonas sp.]|nr:excalibur calcium-binding domain-containing protein [Sulfurimonas sp.]
MKRNLLITCIIFLSSTSLVNAYECDGRKYCSQMSSCSEAVYFLNNCPDPRMDGNNDGVPCEKQHCNNADFFFDSDKEKYIYQKK